MPLCMSVGLARKVFCTCSASADELYESTIHRALSKALFYEARTRSMEKVVKDVRLRGVKEIMIGKRD